MWWFYCIFMLETQTDFIRRSDLRRFNLDLRLVVLLPPLFGCIMATSAFTNSVIDDTEAMAISGAWSNIEFEIVSTLVNNLWRNSNNFPTASRSFFGVLLLI